jgi:hypothetical protein
MQSAMLKYAACMRSHGVPSFPDPTFSGGRVNLRLSPGIASSPQFKSAQQACQAQGPQGFGGAP